MANEPVLRPQGDPERGYPANAPHLSDYWQVLSRRIWVVVAVFVSTTSAAIWAVSRQQTFYQASLAVQIEDPLQQSQRITTATRVSGMQLFTDPIQSEIEVLRSSEIAGAVVDALGLRLLSADGEFPRSILMDSVWVSPEALEGIYSLEYDASGANAQLRGPDGSMLGRAPVYSPLETGTIRFVPFPPPSPARAYALELAPRSWRITSVKQGIAATARESTNLMDATFTSDDPGLAPRILNEAAAALAEFGARRVRGSADREVTFIQERLDSAYTKLVDSQQGIREFKESQQFLNLTTEQQTVIRRREAIADTLARLESQRSRLGILARKIQGNGLQEGDLVTLEAQLTGRSNAQIENLVERINERRQELRAVIQEERKTPDHPQAVALETEIGILEGQLVGAIRANGLVLEDRLLELASRNDALEAQIRQFPELENILGTLELQANLDRGTYEYLLSQLYQAQITAAAAAPYARVVDPAIGAFPIRPRSRMNVLLGGLLGLFFGIGAAFFLEYLDRTVRTSADVETLLGIPVLGVIPRLRRAAGADPDLEDGRPKPMVVASDPVDPAAEAYRNLRMNLTFMTAQDRPVRSITVSSAGPDEGKSTTAVNLAVMMAQQGQRVLLLDADLRRPSLHRTLDLLREPGVTNLLVGDVDLRQAVRPNVLPNLDFLPAGPFPPNPSELLSSRAMQRLLTDLEGRYDSIVVDCPPVLAVTDAALLGKITDGLLLILRSGETEQRAAERAVDQLSRVGVRVIGAVLNEVTVSAAEESYYLQYYYAYKPSQKQGWDRLREGLTKARFW